MRAIDLLLTVDVDTEGLKERVLAAVRSTRRSAAWWVQVAAAAAAALALGVVTARSLPERSSPGRSEPRTEVFASLDQHFGAHANAGFDDLAAELGSRR